MKGSPASSTGAELEAAVAAASGGDRSALAQVIELIRPLVVGYCRARIGTTGRGQLSADDVAQEVCLAVLTALPRYRDQGRPFMAYVYGIASHKVAEAHRAAAARQRDDLAAQPAEQVARQTLSDPAAMDELLTPLPEKDRQILILRLVMGLSAEETAMAIGSTVGVVRVAQHRSLARLKSQVAQASEPTDSDHVIRARESGARQEAGPQL
ncbi:RNA polymerase sigma factor ShbA [Nocardia anaemiae]|uniref:RNA polymerase sigma factor ShbA n=1 Tax=Nocardia anaemiae TaxID=263910 RepID=UPI0035310DC1